MKFLVVDDKIDWITAEKYNQEIQYVLPQKPVQVRPVDYEMRLVRPSYRGSNVYVVTRVDEFLTAASRFPTDEFASYVEYFIQRYALKIENQEQPLLEVKPISTKMNSIKPRYA